MCRLQPNPRNRDRQTGVPAPTVGTPARSQLLFARTHPVHYGRFTTIGDNFYANFNLTVLDTCPVTIGDNVMFGPNVTLTTASHPLRYQQRNARVNEDGELFDYELGAPITIGNNCWLGANVTVLGGVTIGDGAVIGASSVVTKDVPKDALVVGVPGRVVRIISAADRLENFPY